MSDRRCAAGRGSDTWSIQPVEASTIPPAADRSTAETSTRPTDCDGLRTALIGYMGKLDLREREILTCHYGLSAGHQPTTLEQLGARFGITKERVRQIEKRALAKLCKLLPPSLAEHAAL